MEHVLTIANLKLKPSLLKPHLNLQSAPFQGGRDVNARFTGNYQKMCANLIAQRKWTNTHAQRPRDRIDSHRL